MLTATQQKQRIQQLVNQDNATDRQSDRHYREAMLFISAHLRAFYQRYADKNGLSISQTAGLVSKWDLRQWQNAINSMDMSNWQPSAIDRVKALGASVGIDKTHVITSIIKLGLIKFAVQSHKVIHDRVQQDGQSQVKYVAKHMNLTGAQTKKATSIITQKDTTDIWSRNLWVDVDNLSNDVETLVNHHLKHGMSLYQLESNLALYANPKQFHGKQTISSKVHQMDFNTRRIVRTESSRLVNEVNMATYRQVGVTIVNWTTEGGACDKCQALADGGPYKINEAPQVPDSSHPNCRCSITPAGTQYQRYITYNRVF